MGDAKILNQPSSRKGLRKNTPLLALGALGVVFGDIGTSPLYAFRQCIIDLHQTTLTAAPILGILSLIFWSLIFVVCVKYLAFITKADHDGEGGTLAMLALLQSKKPRNPTAPPTLLMLTVFFGSALLYGDGVITPSISVLSAVEGLKIASAKTQTYVVPISVAILVGLFLLQYRGTGVMGNLFGPVMVIWFVAIGAAGVSGICQHPAVFNALNPWWGVKFMAEHGWQGVLVLGAVVLCFTGAEALFADLSQFGRWPIQLGWYLMVLPSLVLNYFGQGAFLLSHPTQMNAPFFELLPHALLYPMVALATVATVIASQALISGTFVLTQQAIHMGYFPRLRITQTSKKEKGQVYIASFNYLLMTVCILIVLGFRSSDKLSGAYGLAVIGTMVVTSLTFYNVLLSVWNWPKAGAMLLTGCFLAVDLSFLVGNVVKIISGAWVPLVLGAVVFAVFWIWSACHAKYLKALNSWAMPLPQFVHEMKHWKNRSAGTGVFLTTNPGTIPLVGKNLWLRENIRPENILLITINLESVPYANKESQIQVVQVEGGCHQIKASFGFMQQPDVTWILKHLPGNIPPVEWEKLVVYLPEACVQHKAMKWRKRWVLGIYEFLQRNSLSIAEYFSIPAREIIHVGVRLDI